MSPAESMPNHPHRTVIIGGGVAGLVLASRLGRGGRVHVVLVDRNSAHVWKPMLHTFASGTADYRSESIGYLDQAARHGFQYVPGQLKEVDRERRQVALGPMSMGEGVTGLPDTTLPYDTLILAIGSQANDFGTPGVAAHCHFIDDVAGAERFNDALRKLAVKAAAQGGPVEVAIVGGGATGVELAAELSKVQDILAGLVGRESLLRLRLTLIESGDRLLGGLPPEVSARALAKLRELGMTIELNARVVSADQAGYALTDGRRIDAGALVWTAGIRAPTVLGSIPGLDVTKTGQLVVHPSLQTTADDAIFALGDCASLPAADGRPLPATAQVARQQAIFLARRLQRPASGSRSAFRYRDFGTLVSLGSYGGYGTLARHGLFPGGFVEGRAASVGHELLYRGHQIELNGLGRGGVLWVSDLLRKAVRPGVRLD